MSATQRNKTRKGVERVIPLSKDEYKALERAMQWPEDLAAYDRANTPTNLTEIAFAVVRSEVQK